MKKNLIVSFYLFLALVTPSAFAGQLTLGKLIEYCSGDTLESCALKSMNVVVDENTKKIKPEVIECLCSTAPDKCKRVLNCAIVKPL